MSLRTEKIIFLSQQYGCQMSQMVAVMPVKRTGSFAFSSAGLAKNGCGQSKRIRLAFQPCSMLHVKSSVKRLCTESCWFSRGFVFVVNIRCRCRSPTKIHEICGKLLIRSELVCQTKKNPCNCRRVIERTKWMHQHIQPFNSHRAKTLLKYVVLTSNYGEKQKQETEQQCR